MAVGNTVGRVFISPLRCLSAMTASIRNWTTTDSEMSLFLPTTIWLSNEFRLTFAPNYEYSSRYNRFVFRAGIPLSLSLQDYENHGSIPCIDRNTRIGFSPSLYVNYDATSGSTFGTTFNFNNSYGDILDLLTSPVMTDYLSMNLKSGIVSHSRKLNLSLRYSFKSPLTMWNFRINTRLFQKLE